MAKKEGAALFFFFSPFFHFPPSPPTLFSFQAFLSSPSELLVSSNTNQEMPAQGAILSRLGSTPVVVVV